MRTVVNRPVLLAVALVLACAAPAAAQRSAIDATVDARLKEPWTSYLADAARDAGLTVTGPRVGGSREARTAVYTKVIERLRNDAELLALFTPAYVQALIDERVESRYPTSVNATSTNPMTTGLPERSGSTSLMALAADLANIASADKTAVSLNVNALMLVTLRDSDLYSSIADYQRHSLARRFSGTVVFGAKIPEAEITGFSGVPDFDTLLDTFGWDVKVRVWGDKDPRSARWSPDTVRIGGLLTQKAAVLVSFVGTPREGEPVVQALEDATIVRGLFETQVGLGLREIKARIARTPQLSVKTSGTHLTRETGRNKYTAGALFDVGVGPTDLTLNAQYAITGDIRPPTGPLFDTKIWTLAGAVTMHLAPDVIVSGRTLDWSAGAGVGIFTDTAAMPVTPANTWRIFTSLEVPVKGAARIPISIVYTNDPNSLTKEKYVRGQVGLSYDFSALKQLFGPGS